MDSSWETRELVVLEAAVRHFDDPDAASLDPSQIAQMTGLDESSAMRALRSLVTAAPPYVVGVTTAEFAFPTMLTDVTERARRTVGQWPTPEGLSNRIVAAIEEVAANASSEDERSRARRVLESVGGVGKGVLTAVLAKVLTEGV
jgi:hypothetical protein